MYFRGRARMYRTDTHCEAPDPMSAVASATSPGDQVVVYETDDGETRVEVRFDRETVWLTQGQMAELFETSTNNVSLHLNNVFSARELEREATTKESLVVRTEGSRQVQRTLTHYNLDAIISVGYRVNSHRGVRFRQWATRTLREHLVRGFTLNQQRLAERGLQEARDTLNLLADTLRNQALVDSTGQEVLDLTTPHRRRCLRSGLPSVPRGLSGQAPYGSPPRAAEPWATR